MGCVERSTKQDFGLFVNMGLKHVIPIRLLFVNATTDRQQQTSPFYNPKVVICTVMIFLSISLGLKEPKLLVFSLSYSSF